MALRRKPHTVVARRDKKINLHQEATHQSAHSSVKILEPQLHPASSHKWDLPRLGVKGGGRVHKSEP